jgi:hypothetical protein
VNNRVVSVIAFPEKAGRCQARFPSSPYFAISSMAADFPDEVLEQLENLDGEFLEYPHNLTDLLFAYVAKHPEEFGDLPIPDA